MKHMRLSRYIGSFLSKATDRLCSLQHNPQRWFAAAILISAFGLTLTLNISQAAWGQTSEATPTAQPSTQPGLQFNFPGVDAFWTPGTSTIAQKVVRLDGRRLFEITAPAVTEKSENDDAAEPLNLRVKIIQDRLQHIATSNFNPKTLRVVSEVDGKSRQPILYVNYKVGEDEYSDQLMTITALDAQLHGTTAEVWAEDLIQTLEDALIRARRERQPSFLRQQAIWAAVIAVVMVVLSLLATFLQKYLRRERKRLSAEAKIESQQVAEIVDSGGNSAPNTGATRITTALLQRQMDNRQKKGVNEIQRRSLQTAQLAIWGGGTFIILGLFPYSRWLQPILLTWLQIPIKLMAIAFCTYLLIRFSAVFADRLFIVLQDSVNLAPEVSQRTALRFSTFSRVIKGILAFVLVGTGVVAALSVIGVEVGPLLAGAGIIGLALSFASQSLLKDIINGFFILLEDQYGVGDVISVGDVSGLVENMNLRITQLRNEEGRLITIPNSAITIVQNLSKEWSRVALRIDVAYSADINAALAVVDSVAQDMSREYPWKDLILEKPLVLGVDKLDYMGTTISLWIKTQPLKQWDVAREYRRRLKLALDEKGISIGVPQQSLWLSNNPDLEDEPFDQIPIKQEPFNPNPKK